MSDAEREWQQLLARVTDLSVEGFYIERRMTATVGSSSVGLKAMLIGEQLDKARILRDDLTAFHTARIAAARAEAAKGVPQGVKR